MAKKRPTAEIKPKTSRRKPGSRTQSPARDLPSGLPAAGDPDAVRRGLADWTDALAGLPDRRAAKALAALAAGTPGKALLTCLFGNSPYLTHLALAEPPLIGRLLTDGPDAVAGAAIAETAALLKSADPPDALMAPLRIAKRRLALAVAVADIGKAWPLDRITGCLSDFAAQAIHVAMGALLREAAARGELELPSKADPCKGSGFVALGMGKLGARELNYSSDIDLIMLFDQEVVRYTGRRTPLECFVRLTQQLVRLLSERTDEGYVFRTDLRLRPDPGSTPVALSMAAAEAYYESFGQNWERAAMIKARAVGGDIAAGNGFLARLTPYVWRKNLDFAAIEDIHSIKRQIHAHRGHAEIAIEGHNLKVGRGGIREIEFFAQTQQLIAGGRDTRLRASGTCEALRALVATERLDQATADELISDYAYLRTVEHRLQMIADEQTHSLPDDPEGIARLACFLGEPSAEAFRRRLLATLGRVKAHYDTLFAEAPALGGEGGSLVFTGTDDDPATLETLRGLGFTDPPAIAAMVRGWHFGRYRAMRSERAREKLTAIMPQLLEAFGRTGSPDAAIGRFDNFLSRLPAGVPLFSLLQSNPGVLSVLAEVLAAAPRLADLLAENAALFDSLIEYADKPPEFDTEALGASLERQLGAARDFQDVLDWTRRWTNELRLQVGIALLRGQFDGYAAGQALSAVADTVLTQLFRHVEAEFVKLHGRVPGADVALLAMGRLGSRELTLESDVDLVLLYEHGGKAEQSDGPKPLTPALYFARLCQRFIGAVTAMTGEGRLFEVDMRLRPSGNAGPIAIGFDAFRDYQRREAWTWEHMALLRGRVFAGPEPFRRRIEKLLRDILCAKRDPNKLLADVSVMRQRIARAKPERNPWALKLPPGGLTDLEFLAQYLQLRHAAQNPEILAGNPADAFPLLGAAKRLDAKAAAKLGAAARLQGTLLAVSRLSGPDAANPAAWPPALRQRLPALVGADDFAALEATLTRVQAEAHRFYRTLVEEPAEPYLALAESEQGGAPHEQEDSDA